MIEQGLDKTWENFDADGSGSIDRQEMRQITIELFKWAKATDSNMFDGKDELTDEMIEELPDLPLGDLAICWPVLGAEARAQDKPANHHLQHLFIHGVLHLLGFNHEAAEDAEEMEHLECVVLEALHIPNPYIRDTANA